MLVTELQHCQNNNYIVGKPKKQFSFCFLQRLFVVKQALVSDHFTLTSILAINETSSKAAPRCLLTRDYFTWLRGMTMIFIDDDDDDDDDDDN